MKPDIEVQEWQFKYRLHREYHAEYYQLNKERIAAYNREYAPKWRAENIERARATARANLHRKRAADPKLRYLNRFQQTVRAAVVYCKSRAVMKKPSKYTGCTSMELRAHLQSLFDVGMDWDNYGRGGWYVAMKVPWSHVNFNDPLAVRAATHFSNLEPRWMPVQPAPKA